MGVSSLRERRSGGSIILSGLEKEHSLGVLIPLNEAKKIKGFRESGDFHVKKEAGQFFLVTPRWDDNIRLKDNLDHLLHLFVVEK